MMDEYDLRVSCRTNALFGCKVQKVGKYKILWLQKSRRIEKKNFGFPSCVFG